MTQQLIFATNNIHKIKEVQSILGGRYRVLTPDRFGFKGDIPETSPTIEGNALQKARFVYKMFKTACFADDTGLEVDVLDGAPGVYSARYAGEDKDSKANIAKLLSELSGNENRKAHFRCVIAYIDSKGTEYLYQGIVNGIILEEEHGEDGFGYDPVFCPDGFDVSFAQMSLEDKNRISHRGIAVRKFTEKLNVEN